MIAEDNENIESGTLENNAGPTKPTSREETTTMPDQDTTETTDESSREVESKYKTEIASQEGHVFTTVGDNPNVTINNHYYRIIRESERRSSGGEIVEAENHSSDELIIENLSIARQNVPLFELVATTTGTLQPLPVNEKEISHWYYGLHIYEQCYVQTTAFLHGAAAHTITKCTDQLYATLYVSSPEGHENDNTGQAQMSTFLSPTYNIPSSTLHERTHTITRRVQGSECLFWQDVDTYGASLFGLRVLNFLANELASKGDHGENILSLLQNWCQEAKYEWRAANALGVLLWLQDISHLRTLAQLWGKQRTVRSRNRSASLLYGAYEIERTQSLPSAQTGNPSVLSLINAWIKQIHADLTQANANLGCTITQTYGLIGRGDPLIALTQLSSLLKLPQSDDTNETRALFTAGVATYVSIAWSGHLRHVLASLASQAELLAHHWVMPKSLDERRLYRQQRIVRLKTVFEAFFLIIEAVQPEEPTNTPGDYLAPLPQGKIAIPDKHRRDLVLAAIVTDDPIRNHVLILFSATLVAFNGKLAFEVILAWVENILRLHRLQTAEALILYKTFVRFLADLYQQIYLWSQDIASRNHRLPAACEIFHQKLHQWDLVGKRRNQELSSFVEDVRSSIAKTQTA